jgi:hypothetical protein
VAERYFTPAEVEALIPALTEIIDDVRAAQVEAMEARERLQAEHERITMSGGGVLDRDMWRDGKDTLDRLAARVRERLEDIARLGGTPKDLGLGLVDFPHLRDGEVVNLCWKHGERSIEYWHALDEGFASRRPL